MSTYSKSGPGVCPPQAIQFGQALTRSGWRGELSSTVIRAPAAIRIGPCCPPREARQRTSAPSRSGNHAGEIGSDGVRRISHWLRPASAMVSSSTGMVQRFPPSTSGTVRRDCRFERPLVFSQSTFIPLTHL